MVQHSQGVTPLLMHWRHASPELRPRKWRQQALDYLSLYPLLNNLFRLALKWINTHIHIYKHTYAHTHTHIYIYVYIYISISTNWSMWGAITGDQWVPPTKGQLCGKRYDVIIAWICALTPTPSKMAYIFMSLVIGILIQTDKWANWQPHTQLSTSKMTIFCILYRHIYHSNDMDMVITNTSKHWGQDNTHRQHFRKHWFKQDIMLSKFHFRRPHR